MYSVGWHQTRRRRAGRPRLSGVQAPQHGLTPGEAGGLDRGAVLADYARTTHLSAPRMISLVKRPPPSGVTTSRPRA